MSAGVVAAGVAAICAASAVGPTPAMARAVGRAAASQSMVMGSPQPPGNLNPALATPGGYGEIYSDLAYAPLINVAANGIKLKPGLATSWHFRGKGFRTLELTLRHNAHFSDGSPVNAKAVIASLKYYGKTDEAPYWATPNNPTYTSHGNFTVIMHMKHPRPEMPVALSNGFSNLGFVIGPQGLKNPTSLSGSTDGAGEYQLDTSKTVTGTKYVFTPNPHYYDPGAIHYGTFTVDVLTDPSTALASVQDGQVQVLASAVSSQISAAKAAGLHVVSGPGEYFTIAFGDLSGKVVPALKKLKVRQALAYAVDQRGILKAVFDGVGNTDQQGLRKGLQGYDPKLTNYYPFNMAKARKLLKQAGYPHGFNAGNFLVGPETGMSTMMQGVVANWAKLGVKVHLDILPVPTWLNDLRTKRFPIWSIGGYYSELPFMVSAFFAHHATTPDRFNSYPTLSKLMNKALTAKFGSAKENTDLKAANDYLVKHVLGIFGVNPNWVYISNPKVSGVTAEAPNDVPVVNFQG